MAEKVVDVIAQKIANVMFDKIVKECVYLCYYKSNIKNLEKQVAELKGVGGEMELDLPATKQKLEVTGPTADWQMNEVAEIKKKANAVLMHAQKFEKGSFKRRLNLKQRYLLSREAKILTENVITCRKKALKHVKLANDAIPTAMLPATSTQKFEGLESRMSTIREVLVHLESDQNNTIAICGMPGIGKTLLVEEILNIVLTKQLFQDAVMVVVSEKPLTEVQGDLAEMLGLPLKETSTLARAQKLHERLKNGSKVPLILDDMLKPLQQRDVGLPATGDYKGLKVLFISQKESAHSPIQAQKHVIVEVLPSAEAWVLFKKLAAECVETKELQYTAVDILAECGALPIAVVTLGKALENGDRYEWENARFQLQNSTVTTFANINELVYQPIQLSYDLLGSRQPQAQQLLMLCCLFPKDANIPVEKLIRYAKGLQLVKDVENLAETTVRVMTLLKELNNCFLLLPGDKEMTVKMHNVVQDVCLSIASKDKHASEDGHRYMVKHDPELNMWPNKEEHGPYTAISLTLTSDNPMHQQLPDDLNYPKLELLQLLFHCDSLNIPQEFFHGMKEVRVLDFKQLSRWGKFLRIDALPPTLEYLLNLRTLSLEFCELGSGDLLRIGRLKKLEILSFFSSKLDELPSQLRELTNLKLLDLRSANGPKFIPSGVLSSMEKLEHLYMGNYDSWSPGTEQSGQRMGISITELSSLPLLNALQVRVKDPMLLVELKGEFEFERLSRFQIAAIRKLLSFREYEIGKSVTFDGVDWSSFSDAKISVLLHTAEWLTLKDSSFKNLFGTCSNLKTLDLYGCEGVDVIMDTRDSAASLNKLKRMDIQSMDDLEVICDGDLPSKSLVELETVKLDSLPELRHLWSAPINSGCLGNLRVLEMSHCEAITSIFPYSIAKCLVQLQKLDIKNCDMLEGIVSNLGGRAAEKVEFQNLSFLSLDELPNFRSFFTESGVENWSSGTMENNLLPREKTENQKKKGCGWFTLKQRPVHTVEYPPIKLIHHELEDSKYETAKFLEDYEESNRQHLFNQLVELPSINKLLVRSLNNLREIVDSQTHRESVSTLRIMHVDWCERLTHVAASDSIRLLESLEQVNIQNCESLEAVFDFRGVTVHDQNTRPILGKLDVVSLQNLRNMKHVWVMVPEGSQCFKTLRTLDISGCCSLNYVFSLSVAKMLENLQNLRIKGSAMVEEIIEIDRGRRKITDTIKFPRLQVLQLDNLSSLTSFSSGNHDFEFPELLNVLIKECPSMNKFCSGHVTAQKLDRIKVRENDDQWVWQGDLNSTIHNINVDRMKLVSEEIEEVW